MILSFLSDLRFALQEGDLTKFRCLLNTKWPLIDFIFGLSGDTLLHTSASKGRSEFVKELLDHHADASMKNSFGNTALMAASKGGYHDIVAMLLNHDAGIDQGNEDGTTALMIASLEGHHEVVKILLNHYAEVNLKNFDGYTALMYASTKGHHEVVKILLDYHADVNAQNNEGNTALHESLTTQITPNIVNVVKLLLSEGGDLEILNKENKAVLELAKKTQNQDIQSLVNETIEQKNIEFLRNELKKRQAKQIVSKRKKKLKEISVLNNNVSQLQQKIRDEKERTEELEKKVEMLLTEISNRNEKIENLKSELKIKIEGEEYRSYEKLKQDVVYFEHCVKTENYDDVINLDKRECPICFNEMKSSQKIYQCQKGHIVCEECFNRIIEGTKLCPFCKIDIATNPIRNRALEEIIETETPTHSSSS